MKYLAIAILVFPLLLSAYIPGDSLPGGASEVETWYWDGSQWVSQGTGDVAALARLWRSNPSQGSCNKEHWSIPVTIHASVAQWIEWSITGTRWDWRVRKPGIYAGDCIGATITSNNDVQIDFDGFDNLQALGNSVNPTIPIWYSFGETIDEAEAHGWIPAPNLDGESFLLEDSQDLHCGLSWKLWNKINVENCNSSCEYEDQAVITLTLKNMKIWVDPASGNFKQPQP